MRDKTSFQIKCSKQVFDLLEKKGLDCHNICSFIDGENESYFQGKIESVNFWIYEDGACIKEGDESKLFEDLDYDTEDELIKDFIKSLLIK